MNKCSIFTSGGINVLVFKSEMKFNLTLKKLKFSVSFMLLLAIMKCFQFLQWKNLYFLSHFKSILLCLHIKQAYRIKTQFCKKKHGFVHRK